MATAEKQTANRYRFAGRMLAGYIRLVRRTARIVADPPDSIERYSTTAPHIAALWHGQFVMVPAVAPNDGRMTEIMVARHDDAEVVGIAMESFGMRLIRGAGAGERRKDRGGRAALVAAIRALSDGNNVAMTADVPPGPARRAGPGIVRLAKLSGRPIVPVAVATNRFLTLSTWSRMTINLPVTRLGVSVGDPIYVEADATGDALEAARREIETAMVLATERAYRACGRNARDAMPAAAMPQDAPPLSPGLKLRAYRGLSKVAAPLATTILARREKRGKELPERRNERLGRPALPRPHGPLIWFHAASVGETNAILPVMDVIAKRRPEQTLLLTTGTVTSAEIATKRLPQGAIHQFVPVDLNAAITHFLDHWQPHLVVLTESELWPNHLMELSDRRIPVILANARMSTRSYKRWRKQKAMAEQLMSRIKLVLAQNEPLARRFRGLGARYVKPVGNIKVDAPPLPVDEAAFTTFQSAVGTRPMMTAASTHPGEEAVVLDAADQVRSQHPGLICVIVPRHPHRAAEIETLARRRTLNVAVRSRGETLDRNTDVYLADTLGELGLFYRAASFAFIGGSIADKGGQNPIEPARERCAILAGPNTYNFKDAYDELQKAGALRRVTDAQELADAVAALLTDDVALELMQRGGTQALGTLTGALSETVDAIIDELDQPASFDRAAS